MHFSEPAHCQVRVVQSLSIAEKPPLGHQNVSDAPFLLADRSAGALSQSMLMRDNNFGTYGQLLLTC
jgi:hypothetical protein